MSTSAAPQPRSRLPERADRAVPVLLASAVGLLSLASYPQWTRPEVLLFAVAGAVGWLWSGRWPALVVAAYQAGTRLRGRRLLTAVLVAAVVVGTLTWPVPVAGPRAGDGPATRC